MHEYVQKSTSTTLPRSAASDSGRLPGVFSQSAMPVKSGAVPRSGNATCGAFALAFVAAAANALSPPRSESRCFCASDVSSTCFWIEFV